MPLTGYFTETTRRPVRDVAKASLTGPVGLIGDDVMRKVCSAVSYALGC